MRFALSFCLALAATAAQSQEGGVRDAGPPVSLEGPFTLCVLHEDESPDLREHAQALRTASLAGTGSTEFEVAYTGFSPEAQAAFQAAVDIWATMIDSPQTIRIDASFTPLGGNVLGSAGAASLRGGGLFVQPQTWYGRPLYDAITNTNLDGDAPDIVARFSSNFARWYFGTDGTPGSNEVDFVSVVLHELGHGLGFFGSAARDDGISGPSNLQECDNIAGTFCHSLIGYTTQNWPVIYDRSVEDATGTSILNATAYPNPSPALGAFLQGGNAFMDSPSVTETNGGTPAEIYAPGAWNRGSSYSHWDENTFTPATSNSLMTPFIGNGEAYSDPGPLTCALFLDLGWVLGPGCAAVVPNEAPPVALGTLSLDLAGPNPFRSQTAVRLSVEEPQAVRVVLLDALGREVSRLYEGAAAAGPLRLRLPGGLAPGLYVVRAEGETGVASVRLARAR